MEQQARVWVEGDRVLLKAPPSPRLESFIVDLPSRWDTSTGTISWPVELAPHIVALSWSVFGTDGTAPLATVHLNCASYANEREIRLAERMIVRRESSNRRPILSPGVARISGAWSWEGIGTGSFGDIRLGINDAVLLFQLPEQTARQLDMPGLTIVPTVDRISALWAESQRLEARLAVIRKQLNA